MEKEYVDALLKDLKKAYTPNEKVDVITTFVTLLSEYQNKSTEALEKATKHLTDISNALETLNDSNEKLFARILNLEERFSRIELNLNLPSNGKKTEIEKAFVNMHNSQAQVLKSVTHLTKKFMEQDKGEIKLYNTVTKLYKDIESLYIRLEKIENR